jgi:hypothetical protein
MSRIEIHPYNGDLEALRKLAYRSWTAEYSMHKDGSWPDLYTPTISRYYFDACDPRLLVSAYLDGEMIGFLANLPRQYRFRGRCYKGMLTSFLAISPDFPGALGPMLAACLQGNKEFGVDLALFEMEKDHKTLQLARKFHTAGGQSAWLSSCLVHMRLLVHAIDFPVIREHEGLGGLQTLGIKAWGAHRPILPGRISGVVRSCQPEDLPGVLALTGKVSDRDQLVRVFDLPTLERCFNSGDLSTRLGGLVVHELQGKINAFISFSTYDMVNARGTHPWAWIDLVCWEDCSPQEKHALIACVWALCKERGCIGMLIWTKQRVSYLPFYRAGFFPYPRPMDLQVGILDRSISIQGALGVFEQVL